ncbi:DUF429 domain-containing protein [Paenibacillus sp. LMG 31456]|uniref:DUF429 domain-containing protein n=1 Tax=Paenibacillus foliorum TaxID=2654974 RepID=A0A972K1W3_9BACL|nr:DUF429 domain-containing protein [Paenibacillus foliorum]NOU96141.1 DUF429 domain-containing protein [Paenibacillus foliorum]
MISGQTYGGIDGCRGGWIAVTISAMSGDARTHLYSSLFELWKELNEAELLLLDMPIGLKSAGREERRCDLLARQLLRPKRTSSIFPAPVRGVLDAADYAEANVINRRMGERGLSKQTWHLVPKIREVDSLLRSDENACNIFREAHPEVCFASLFGAPMTYNKKTEEGYRERIDWLLTVFPKADKFLEQAMSQYRRSAAARDDLVDALVLAVSGVISRGELSSLPDPPEQDIYGIPMSIWHAKRDL